MRKRLLLPSDKIFVAGAKGMAGSAIVRALKRNNYGDENEGRRILTPSRKELDLLEEIAVSRWMEIHKPDIVIVAAAKVGV